MKRTKWYETIGLVVILALTLFAGVSCSKTDAGKDLAGVTWVLQSYGLAKLTPAVPGVETYAIFHPEWKQVRGSGGVNVYSGDYLVEGNKLSVSGILHTLIGARGPIGEQENRYFTIMESAKTFRIDGKQLTITGAEGTLVFAQK